MKYQNQQWRHLKMERSVNGTVCVRIDVADHSMNVFNDSVLAELEQVITELEQNPDTDAVLFQSGKSAGFFAGADVRQIAELKSREQVEQAVAGGQSLFSRIERLPMPTIAVIHGPCLGGGLEFAMACRYRIALHNSATRLGLPEVQLGLIPGWGGTQRLPRLVGLANALPLILRGNRLTARQAWEIGLVDGIADESHWEALIARFRDGDFGRIEMRADLPVRMKTRLKTAVRSVIRHTYRITDRIGSGRRMILKAASRKIARDARNYPALSSALIAVEAGFDAGQDGFLVERSEFAKLIETPTCRNLLNLFFWREKARSVNTDGSGIRKVAIIGAGAMGAGIGQLAAIKGFEVVLKELTPELAAAGRQRVHKLLNDMVRSGKLSDAERQSCLQRLTFTDLWEPVADADLAIEAVVEKLEVKQQVFAELDQRLKSSAIIVSNTSALSVSAMAQVTRRADQVAGLHFFNPVHRMDLVEVIAAPETSQQTVKLLLAFLRKLGKTPVNTTDSPGFVVNRILFPYLGESIRMVMEGQDPGEIDREIRRFGMPMGPLELMDYVGLDVGLHVATTLRSVLPESDNVIPSLQQMVDAGLIGLKCGKGFYLYKNGKRQESNRLALHMIARGNTTVDSSDHGTPVENSRVLAITGDGGASRFLEDGMTMVQRRLIYPMINEAAFCIQEGVAAESWMIDLAMVLGTGFAPFRGGPLTMADQIGLETVLNNLAVLGAYHGERFKPAAVLAEQRAGNQPVSSIRHTAPVMPEKLQHSFNDRS